MENELPHQEQEDMLALFSMYGNDMARLDAVQREYRKIAERHHLTLQQMKILIQMLISPEATRCDAAFLSGRVGIERNSVIPILDSLIARSLIERQAVAPTRRKKGAHHTVEFRLTPAGRQKTIVLFPELHDLNKKYVPMRHESLTSLAIGVTFYEQKNREK